MDKATTIVAGNRVHRPLLDDRVTAEDWKKAKEELNETPETRAALLKRFKERLAEEKVILLRTDDIYLLRFLRTRKFDLERAYKLMLDHYSFRAQHPAIFPSPSSIETALRANIFEYLPHRDHMGRSIFVVRIRNWNPHKVSYQAFVAAGHLMTDYVLENPVTQINGFIGVWDFKGFSLKQFVPFCSPKNIWLLTSFMQDRLPGRFKIAFCLNCHHLVNTGWNLFKPLLKEKFRHRIKIMGSDVSALHAFVDPSILPKEYGGSLPQWNSDDFLQRVLDKGQLCTSTTTGNSGIKCMTVGT